MHVALDRNPGPGYDTLPLRLIPGDLLSAFTHRLFNTLSGLVDNPAKMSNFYSNARVPSREAIFTIFMMVFGMGHTRDLPHERRTR